MDEVSRSISSVEQGAAVTGDAASNMSDVIAKLVEESTQLEEQLEAFMAAS